MKPAKDVDPRIDRAAREIGVMLFRHQGELWVNCEYQITFRAETRDGISRELDDEGRVLLAVRLLNRIRDARLRWPGVAERFAKIVDGLEETIPHYNPRTYTYYRDPTLDQGWMIRMQWSGDADMAVELSGVPTIRVRSDSLAGCIAELRQHELYRKARGETHAIHGGSPAPASTPDELGELVKEQTL